jgi:hypothetical protein
MTTDHDQEIAGYATPEAIARRCLHEADGDYVKALALIRKYVLEPSHQLTVRAALLRMQPPQ